MKNHILKSTSLITAIFTFLTFSAPAKVNAEQIRKKSHPGYSIPKIKYSAGGEFGSVRFAALHSTVHDNVPEVTDMPSSYDMRDVYGVSAVKNQAGHGTCWAHSSVAAAETDLIRYIPDIDLSELHTAFFSYYGDDQIAPKIKDVDAMLDEGGNSAVAVNLWSQWIGPVYDSKLPYDRDDIVKDKSKVDGYKYQSDFHLENAVMLDYNYERTNTEYVNQLIKQYVMNGNGVDATFYSNGEKCFESKYCSTNSNKKPKFSNHAIVIIGWDDNFPASDFRIKPDGNGAWLVKNSWGTTYGKDGYMWISYYDKSLGEFTVYDMGDKNNYSTIYQHDSYVPIQTLSGDAEAVEGTPSYMANLFTAEQDQQIEAVSTYFVNEGTDFEITVYTDLKDEEDFRSGKASCTTKGKHDVPGYFTIELDEPVHVGEGERFAIMMKLWNSSTPFVIPIETVIFAQDWDTGEITEIGGYTDYDNIIKNTDDCQSFYSSDGKEWYTSSDGEYIYEDDEKDQLLDNFISQVYDGVDVEDAEEMEAADKTANGYRELFSHSDIGIILGNISFKAFGNPCGAVKFSHISGAVPLDEAVEMTTSDDSDVIYSTDNGSTFIKYEQPIKIEKDTEIVTAEKCGSISRSYRPSKSEFFSIGYVTDSASPPPAMKYAKKTGDNVYEINLSADDELIRFYPISDCVVKLKKNECTNYSFTDSYELNRYKNVFLFSLNKENALDNAVTVIVNRGEDSGFRLGDANGNGLVDAVDASDVLCHYAQTSVGNNGTLDKAMIKYADYNNDSIVDSRDASEILRYYANESVS